MNFEIIVAYSSFDDLLDYDGRCLFDSSGLSGCDTIQWDDHNDSNEEPH